MSPKTRFENLLEAVPDALVGMDQKGVIRFVNRQTESLFGYDREQLIGQPIEMLVPEPLWQMYADLRDNYFADPRTRSLGLEVELTGRQQDGSEFPIDVNLAHINTGDILLVIRAGRDVIQQHHAVQTAQLTSAIVEYSDDAIIGMTLDGIITSWNPAAERLYGYSSKEIIGRSGSLLSPGERAGELNAILARIRQGHYVEHSETTLFRKDGTLVPVSVAASPIRDDDGNITGVSAVHRDVTALRHALQVAQRLASIVENSDDAIIGRTLGGIITSWNPAAETMFGYSGEEIVGKPIELLLSEDQADELKTLEAKLSAAQPVQHLETSRVRKDGTAFPVSLTVSPIRDDGSVVGASEICRDMSRMEHAAEYARSLIEAGQDPLMTISPGGKVHDVNAAAVTITGVSRDKLIGTDFARYFTDPDKAHEGYLRAFDRGTLTDYPLTLRRGDGTRTDVLFNASVYRDFNGQVLGVSGTAHDVTGQKEAFATAQRMEAIVQSSDDAIISGSLDGLVTSWNPAAERMYGYSSAEIIGKPASMLTPKDRAGEVKAVLEEIKAGHHVEHLETGRARKDGTVFPVSLTVSPIRDANGAVVGTSVIHRDLTEQRGSLASAQRIAAIVEYSDDAIIGRTIDGTVTSWNPAAERMFGYSSEEMVGKSLELLAPPDRAGERISILAKISAGRAVHHFETIRVREDGTAIPVSLTVSPIRDDKGKVVGASVIYRDVSELKHAAQYARSLIEAVLDPLEMISPEGMITDVNEAAVKATGVPRNKLIGTDFASYFTDPDRARQGYQRVFAEGSVTDYPLTLRHRDGTLTDLLCNASICRDTNGDALGVLAAAHDVTRKKEADPRGER